MFFRRFGQTPLVIAATVLGLATPALAHAQDDDGDDGPGKPVTALTITAKRLDAARANIVPSLGAATYALTNETVESRPGGETTSINQVLLQVPGVQQDGSGQLHVRQSQGDLQYRINNVIIPEGMSDLGEAISARIAQRVELVTGALPAQYGFQAGGVVNVTTKSGAYLEGGQAELYGGGRGEIEPAFEYGASFGKTNLFMSGSFLRNRAGGASLDGSARPSHDRTDQVDGFAYLDRPLSDDTRVSLILGLSDDRLQDPNPRGLTAPAAPPSNATYRGPLTVNGLAAWPSEALSDHRRDVTRFAVASLIKATDKYTVQAAAFARRSGRYVEAAGDGDLIYKGVAQSSFAHDLAYGAQVEGVYEASAAHTLRAGLVSSQDELHSGATLRVLRVDASGRQTSDAPKTLAELSSVRTRRNSAFLQDEWRLADTVTLNTGGRLDIVSGLYHETAFSPRASLVWTPTSKITLHLGYARYFLPTPVEEAGEKPGELANTTAAWPTTKADPLRAERDDYYDVGLQRAAGDLTLGVDGYWRAARNLIAEGRFGPGALTRSFNYETGRILGVEFTATYAHGPFAAWANLTVSRSEGRRIISNQAYFTAAQLDQLNVWRPLAQNQTYAASGGASYRLGDLKVSGDVLYGGGLPRTAPGGIVNGARLASRAQINLAAVYRAAEFNQRPLDLRLDVVNAFDVRRQFRDGTGLGDGPPQWGQRRGVFVGVEQAF